MKNLFTFEEFLNEARFLSKSNPVYKTNFENGKEAFSDDEFVAQNPHAKDDEAGYAWMDGWLSAAREAKADEKRIMKFVEQWADAKYVSTIK
jgi:hypothetical protein